MDARAVITVRFEPEGAMCDVDVPLDIDAGELHEGLDAAFDLEHSPRDATQPCLRCERPTKLLKGKRTLGQHGVHTGSIITVSGRER